MIDADILRRKIIDFAVFGKLTEHLPSEGDASEWLLNNDCQYFDSAESDIALPSNWCWTTLSRITDENTLNDGNWVLKADMVSEGAVKLIQLGSIGEGVYRDKGFKYLTEEHFHELNGRQIFSGYLLINRLVVDRMCSCIIPPIEGILMTAVDVCWVAPQDELYSLKYIMYAVSTSMFQQHVNDLGHGVTRFRISKNNLIEIPFPFPPLNEQIRIVDKIEELFSLLNTLNDLQQQYESDQEILKGKIIDAGIRGKLTEQLLEDGDAEELVKRITAEKEKLIEEGRIPKEKKLQKIKSEEIPFEIPESWCWVRVQDVASYITDYVANGSFATLKAHTKTYKEPNYAIFVRTMDLSSEFKDGCAYIDKDSYDFLEKSRLYGGELILPNIGASIGKAFIMPDLKMPMSLAPNSILLKFTEPIMNEYFSYVVKSTYGNKILNKTQGGSATAKFSKTDLRSLIVPLPPLREQKRIVKTLDESLKLLF